MAVADSRSVTTKPLSASPPAARLLAGSGALAPVIFMATWVVAGFVQDSYSARREDISALAARSAEHPWLMIVGLVTTGLLVAGFALVLHRAVRPGSIHRRPRAPRALWPRYGRARTAPRRLLDRD